MTARGDPPETASGFRQVAGACTALWGRVTLEGPCCFPGGRSAACPMGPRRGPSALCWNKALKATPSPYNPRELLRIIEDLLAGKNLPGGARG